MWQPIETAPKIEEGENLLLLEQAHPDDYPSNVFVGFWSTGAYGDRPEGFWANWHTNLEASDDEWEELKFVTHWQPLPEPPER